VFVCVCVCVCVCVRARLCPNQRGPVSFALLPSIPCLLAYLVSQSRLCLVRVHTHFRSQKLKLCSMSCLCGQLVSIIQMAASLSMSNLETGSNAGGGYARDLLP